MHADTANQIIPAKLTNQARQFGWVILQIAVEGGDNFATAKTEAGSQSGALTAVSQQSNGAYAVIRPLRFKYLFPCAIGAAVIDQNHLQLPRGLL